MNERSQICLLMKTLGDLYGRSLSDTAVALLATAWEPYSAERLRMACELAVAEHRFMPTVNELKALVAHHGMSQLAQDVGNEWIRRNGFGAGLPSQEQINQILSDWGMEPGAVTRLDLASS